jgi:hypothetical protein
MPSRRVAIRSLLAGARTLRGGLAAVFDIKAKSFNPPAAERISVIIFGLGAVMLALGLVAEYYRLVH